LDVRQQHENLSEGLRFIQSKKNRALPSGIKTSPYEALFGTAQRIGLGDSPLTEDMYSSIETEEMEQLFNAGMNNSPKLRVVAVSLMPELVVVVFFRPMSVFDL